jgi:hypothetical protein
MCVRTGNLHCVTSAVIYTEASGKLVCARVCGRLG